MSPEQAQAMAAHVAKGHADEAERDAADAKRAAEEKRERIHEGIVAAAVVDQYFFAWRHNGDVTPVDMEEFARDAESIADLWRETVAGVEGKMGEGSKG